MKTHKFTVIIERDEDEVLIDSVPTLPGCHTQANSLDELMVIIKRLSSYFLNFTKKTQVTSR